MTQQQSEKKRSIIVTADDFGAAPCIDNAIRSAVATGQITAVSALTNYPRSTDAIASLHRDFPELGIGVHLNITSGPPRTDPIQLGVICDSNGAFLGLAGLMDQLGDVNRATLEYELRAQIETIFAADVVPDHLSSHHNILAIYPPFQDIMLRLAQEYRLPVRTPMAISQTHSWRFGYAKTRQRAIRNIVGLLRRRPRRALRLLPGTYLRLMRSKRLLRELGIPAPDHMIDSLYGEATVRNIRHILQHLPSGVSELVVHLGECNAADDLPDGIETEILTERTIERNLILNGTLKNVLRREGISIARYRDLG